MADVMGDFWVFGYGSLIWNPGFSSMEMRPAKIYGRHRALCIYSWVHRGTRQAPGLVLGLDNGGSCRGIAYKVSSKNSNAVLEYLRGRELVTNVYKETWCRIYLDNGNVKPALTYVVDRSNAQYCGNLELKDQIEIISSARGNSGTNCDYINNTVEHLRTIAIHDGNLEKIVSSIKPV